MSPVEDLDFLVVCVSRGQERHAVRGLTRVDLRNSGLLAVGTAALESWFNYGYFDQMVGFSLQGNRIFVF